MPAELLPASDTDAAPVDAPRYGFRASCCAVLPEEAQWFHALLRGLVARLKPLDEVEVSLVDAMAVLELKLLRLDALELQVLGGFSDEGTARPPSLGTLASYRSRLLKERWDIDHRLQLLVASRCTNEAEAKERQARMSFLESWAAKTVADARQRSTSPGCAPPATPAAEPPANRQGRRRREAELRRAA